MQDGLVVWMVVGEQVPREVLSIVALFVASSKHPTLYVLPEPFNVVGVNTRLWVNKVLRVVNNEVSIALVLETTIRLPRVNVDGGAWQDVLLAQRDEGGSVSPLHR